MKNRIILLLPMLALLAFSCQKQITSSFSPSTPRTYVIENKNLKKADQKQNIGLTEANEEIAKEKSSEDFSTPVAVNPEAKEMLSTIPAKATENQSNKEVKSEKKAQRKEVINQIKDLKKSLKSSDSNKNKESNTSVFLIVLLILLLALLIPGLLYWVLVALVIWLILYLLGLI